MGKANLPINRVANIFGHNVQIQWHNIFQISIRLSDHFTMAKRPILTIKHGERCQTTPTDFRVQCIIQR